MDPENAALRMKLARMNQDHNDLKTAIDAMIAQRCDPLAVQRLKKRKLDLKDEITRVSSAVIPDITA